MEKIIFYLFASLTIFSALMVVNLKNQVRALFLFFVVLFLMASLYLFALADFVAVTQILVYVGGVLILMIFAFMLSNKMVLNDTTHFFQGFITLKSIPSLIICLGFTAIMLYGLWEWRNQELPNWIINNTNKGLVIKPTNNTIHELGVRTITTYLLPFEIISIFLLMSLIGAAHIARKGGVKKHD